MRRLVEVVRNLDFLGGAGMDDQPDCAGYPS